MIPEGTAGFELRGGPAPWSAVWRDVWRSRGLLGMLARKEFFVRYRRASLGVAWAVLLPLAQAVVLAIVLPRFVRFRTGVDYTVFVYAGTLAWGYFSATLTTGAGSIVDGQDLSTKVYFPRSLFPLTSAVSGLYGLVISVGVLIAVAVAVGTTIRVQALWAIPAIALSVTLASGFALVLAMLHVYFRDMRYIVQASLIAWFYITPVFYPMSAVGRLRTVLLANPATGIVELFRLATGGADPGWVSAVVSTSVWSVGLLALAAVLYRAYDRVCTDLL